MTAQICSLQNCQQFINIARLSNPQPGSEIYVSTLKIKRGLKSPHPYTVHENRNNSTASTIGVFKLSTAQYAEEFEAGLPGFFRTINANVCPNLEPNSSPDSTLETGTA